MDPDRLIAETVRHFGGAITEAQAREVWRIAAYNSAQRHVAELYDTSPPLKLPPAEWGGIPA